MLAIRLQRMGKKNQPSYRVVVSEKNKDLYGKHNEILGNYDPTSNPKIINLKADRIKYWISVGAKPSPTVHNLLVNKNIIDDKKIQSWKPKKKEKSEEGQKKETANENITQESQEINKLKTKKEAENSQKNTIEENKAESSDTPSEEKTGQIIP